MARKQLGVLLLGSLAFIVAGSAARAQDTIEYYDRAKKAEAKATGAIQEETPAHVSYKVGGKTEKIAAIDIREITYRIPVTLSREYRIPLTADNRARQAANENKEADRKKFYSDALKEYPGIIDKVNKTGGPELTFAARYLEYKMCLLLAWEADDDETQVEPAIKALNEFKDKNPGGWEIVPAMKTLARLQQEKKGDVAGAQKTFEELSRVPGIPAEVKQECDLLVVKALIDDKKHAQAETKLKELARSLKADDPQALRVQVYLADCQAVAGQGAEAEKKLDDIISKTTDPDVKALAYNTLGDCLLRRGTPEARETAFWDFLWVDAVYNGDKAEQARALYHLSKLFIDVKRDDARASQCKERLKDKLFSGVEYQRRALKEEKKEEK
jgi:hypothetical protein